LIQRPGRGRRQRFAARPGDDVLSGWRWATTGFMAAAAAMTRCWAVMGRDNLRGGGAGE